MPHIITPRTYAVIFLASLGHEVSGFLTPLPAQLLAQAQERAFNFCFQYGALAASQATLGSPFDPMSPAKLFKESAISIMTASTPEEAASRGTVALGVLILSGVSTETPNASLAYGAFLAIILPDLFGPHTILPVIILKIFYVKKILIRLIAEIRIERKRKKLGLPRAKLKFNLFRNKERKDFVFKYIRFKKRKIKILSRNISLPVGAIPPEIG